MRRHGDLASGRPGSKCSLIICLVLFALGTISIPSCQARMLRDQAGRDVMAPDDPRRVVSLAPSITEMVFALGAGDRLKGVTQYSDYPKETEFLPRVGSYVHPDLERIVALQPDLCIATRDGNPREVVERLDALKIPVYVVNPRDLDTVLETIGEMGRLLNAGPKAQALTDDLRGRIERVKSRVAKAKQRPGVFFQIGVVPIVSVGANTFIDELIAAAGGRNLAEGSTPYPRFSREQVLSLQPDVLIITSMTRGLSFDQVKAEWSQWDSLPAVRNQRVYVVDSDIFDRPTPRLVEGLEILARLIHPELF